MWTLFISLVEIIGILVIVIGGIGMLIYYLIDFLTES